MIGSLSGKANRHWIAGTMPLSIMAPAFAPWMTAPRKKCRSTTLPRPIRSSIQAMMPVTGSMPLSLAILQLSKVCSLLIQRATLLLTWPRRQTSCSTTWWHFAWAERPWLFALYFRLQQTHRRQTFATTPRFSSQLRSYRDCFALL